MKGIGASTIMSILGIIVLILVVAILISCIKIVHQAQALVIERLGAYQATWSVGIHFKSPIIERVARRIDLKEQVVDFEPQAVITKDNVTMQIDTVVFYQITDPKLFCYGVASPIMAIENLTATTLRNIIGDLELDQTLTSRETINTKMRSELDLATDPWGIKVNRVELKNIIPPAAIRDAMEKQMKAERERREAILRAEGEKKSTILVAEGEKESAILNAEADKQAAILHAEAEKEKMIREAEGEAEAILKVQKANADGLRSDLKKPRSIRKGGGRQSNEDHHSVRDSGRGRSREIAGRNWRKRDRKRGITVAHNTRDRGEYHRPDRSMEAGRTEAKSRQQKESEESKTAVDDRSGRNVCFRKDNAGR